MGRIKQNIISDLQRLLFHIEWSHYPLVESETYGQSVGYLAYIIDGLIKSNDSQRQQIKQLSKENKELRDGIIQHFLDGKK